MKKIFSKVMGLICTFALLFCFTGCVVFPGTGGGGNGGYYPGGGTAGGGGTGGSSDYHEEFPNEEFEKDEQGNYTYFSDFIDTFNGVRLVCIPPAGAKSGNELTDAERSRFYANVYTQFEVLAKIILYSLVGEYGGGISSTLITGSDTTSSALGELATKINYGDDYQYNLNEIIPKVAQNRIGDIVSTNEYNIEYDISGYKIENLVLSGSQMTYDITFGVDMSKKWILNLNKYVVPTNAEQYAEEYVETFCGFVQLRLMEIVLNKTCGTEYQTTWAYASNAEDCNELIIERTKKFKKLGFVFGDKENTESVAYNVQELIVNEIIGEEKIEYDKNAIWYIEDAEIPNVIMAEPYTDENENKQYDFGEPFTDLNRNDVWDNSLYIDLNVDGKFNDGVNGNYCKFYNGELNMNYIRGGFIPNIVDSLNLYVDGEPFTDLNGNNKHDDGEQYTDVNENGIFDEGLINIHAMEARDLTAKEFFTPGIEGTKDSPRKLDNMPYAEYKSATFFPKEDNAFDAFTIYLDSETDFSVKIWLKVHIGDKEFYAPICILNTDNTKDADWENEDETNTSTDDESWTKIEDLFNNKKRNAVWLVELDKVLTLEQYEILTKNKSSENKTEFSYLERGFHTNSKDNITLADLYGKMEFGESYIDINANGKYDMGETFEDANQNQMIDRYESFVYKGEGDYYEFIFEILDPQPDVEYNFKFLIMPEFWDVENEFEEDFDDEDFG